MVRRYPRTTLERVAQYAILDAANPDGWALDWDDEVWDGVLDHGNADAVAASALARHIGQIGGVFDRSNEGVRAAFDAIMAEFAALEMVADAEPRPGKVRQRGSEFLSIVAKAGAKASESGTTRSGKRQSRVVLQSDGWAVYAENDGVKALTPENKAFFDILAGRAGDEGMAFSSYEELSALRGQADGKKFRRKVRDAVEDLSRLQWRGKSAKGENLTINYFEATGSDRKGITVKFTDSFMGLAVKRAAFYDMPDELFKFNAQKYPAAYEIGQKLYRHTMTNAGRKDKTPYRLSVAKLLESVPSIPNPKAVEKSNQTYRCIRPLQAGLDHLVEIGFLKSWDYCAQKGAPAPREWLDAMLDPNGEATVALPWSMAKSALVTWEPAKEWVTDELLATRKERALMAEAAKLKRADLDAKDERARARAKAKRAGEIAAEREASAD